MANSIWDVFFCSTLSAVFPALSQFSIISRRDVAQPALLDCAPLNFASSNCVLYKFQTVKFAGSRLLATLL